MNVGKIIAESCHVTADFRDAVLLDFPNRFLASVPQPIGPYAVGSLARPHARGAGFKQRTWPVPLLGPRGPFKIHTGPDQCQGLRSGQSSLAGARSPTPPCPTRSPFAARR